MTSKFKKTFFRFVLQISLAATVLITVLFLLIYAGVWGEIPGKDELSSIQHNVASQVTDRNGKLVGKFYLFDREPIDFEEIPDHLIHALIATEDVRFYQHHGIDIISLGRVAVKTLLMGDRSAGGGSTLTQQLAKNLYPRTDLGKGGMLIHKVRESIIAWRLEDLYSKEELIALYLNTVSFPDNTFGIESASRRFFSKPVSQLDLPEAALLVGSLKATYTYNPRLFPEKSMERRNVVLHQMTNYSYLEQGEYDQLSQIPPDLKLSSYSHKPDVAPYFLAEVKKEVQKILKGIKKPDGGKYDLLTDGLHLHTTLDLQLHKDAESNLSNHLTELQKQLERDWGNNGPWLQEQVWNRSGIKGKHLSVVEPRNIYSPAGDQLTDLSVKDSLQYMVRQLQAGHLVVGRHGDVRVWIGGPDFEYFKFDHVSQSRRQVGSVFKPFIYSAALEEGYRPCDYQRARQVSYQDLEEWTPENSEENYDLRFSLEGALSHSVNTIAVKLLEEVGIETVIEQAKSLGLQANLPEVPALALGVAELSVKEVTGMYTPFLNGGYVQEIHFMQKIEDRQGNTIWERTDVEPKQVYSEQTSRMMLHFLQATIDDGTGKRLRWKYGINAPLAGKTGTTQDNRDGWFVGITPELISVSWVGADDPRIHFRTTQYGQGANTALPLFGLMMQDIQSARTYHHYLDSSFPRLSATEQNLLDCPPVKEENFLQKVFSNSEKPKERDFNRSDRNGLLDRVKGWFQKNSDENRL